MLHVALRPSPPPSCPSRSCTSTPVTTSPRSSSSGTAGSPGRRAAGRGQRAGRHRRRPGRRGHRPPRHPQPAADGPAAGRHRAAPLRLRVRWSPAGRGRRPGPRSGCSASGTTSASGTPEPAPRAVEPLPAAATARRAHPVFPLSNWTELDIWQCIGPRTSRCRRSRRAPPPGVRAGRHVAGGLAVGHPARRRGADGAHRAVPHRRGRHLLAPSSPWRRTWRRSSRRRR